MRIMRIREILDEAIASAIEEGINLGMSQEEIKEALELAIEVLPQYFND